MSMNSIAAVSHGSHAAAFSEDGPGCGTHPPGWHPPFPHAELAISLRSSLADKLEINPQPLPPREDSVSLSASANPRFDDGGQCGNVPRHFPPPSPPPVPWLDTLKAMSSISPSIAQQLSERGIIIIGG